MDGCLRDSADQIVVRRLLHDRQRVERRAVQFCDAPGRLEQAKAVGLRHNIISIAVYVSRVVGDLAELHTCAADALQRREAVVDPRAAPEVLLLLHEHGLLLVGVLFWNEVLDEVLVVRLYALQGAVGEEELLEQQDLVQLLAFLAERGLELLVGLRLFPHACFLVQGLPSYLLAKVLRAVPTPLLGREYQRAAVSLTRELRVPPIDHFRPHDFLRAAQVWGHLRVSLNDQWLVILVH